MIICGDVLTELKTLPDNFIYCCVTSPPYWGLRDYGTAKWEGGDEKCDHADARLRSRFERVVLKKGINKLLTLEVMEQNGVGLMLAQNVVQDGKE